MRSESGFTLLELMIVIMLIAVIATIAIPNILSARQTANERAAMATMRSISTAQAQFQASVKADEDMDGTGEYGGLGELAGVVAVRGGTMKVPTDLSGAFRNVSDDGEVSRSGYCFRLYLPEADGAGRGENAGGGYDVDTVDSDLCETTWCVYAWPINRGNTGRKVFCANQLGEIVQTTDCEASGAATAEITAGSAYMTSDATMITGQIAVGASGSDGHLWRRAN